MGSIERMRTTWVVKNFPKIVPGGEEKDENKKVDVEVSNPKNCVAFENCLGGTFEVVLDVTSAHFRDLEESERKFMSVEVSRCENIQVKFTQCHQNLSINNSKKCVIEVTGAGLGTVELNNCKDCKIFFTGYEEGATPGVQVLHSGCTGSVLCLPYKDKYGENMREIALPTRIITVFESESKIASKADEAN
mmetsp:Transcript_9691/g.18471  ORF Transcript_9691/g.18471 Transcript_9691/m.18471 type:complete len:191 (+) Transcript_9691:49-621(+)|eukprot:CAMPEP_0175140766 /NCGR_PEP_ID=MMETSP0087-20121206/11706_1 /TAXON_ID=136419 /ORGANISM="Unknown Unknown, Strain D1" /LENGTH=190 /DNA_ID=CAMNT_0016424055 /DNA_START=53 /DNA_END=625 /DNA_ORIENTATION=+